MSQLCDVIAEYRKLIQSNRFLQDLRSLVKYDPNDPKTLDLNLTREAIKGYLTVTTFSDVTYVARMDLLDWLRRCYYALESGSKLANIFFLEMWDTIYKNMVIAVILLSYDAIKNGQKLETLTLPPYLIALSTLLAQWKQSDAPKDLQATFGYAMNSSPVLNLARQPL